MHPENVAFVNRIIKKNLKPEQYKVYQDFVPNRSWAKIGKRVNTTFSKQNNRELIRNIEDVLLRAIEAVKLESSDMVRQS